MKHHGRIPRNKPLTDKDIYTWSERNDWWLSKFRFPEPKEKEVQADKKKELNVGDSPNLGLVIVVGVIILFGSFVIGSILEDPETNYIEKFNVTEGCEHNSPDHQCVYENDVNYILWVDCEKEKEISLTGTTLSIEGGNSVDLSLTSDDTEPQTLSQSGGVLMITRGNGVSFSVDEEKETFPSYIQGVSSEINNSIMELIEKEGYLFSRDTKVGTLNIYARSTGLENTQVSGLFNDSFGVLKSEDFYRGSLFSPELGFVRIKSVIANTGGIMTLEMDGHFDFSGVTVILGR